MITEKMRSKTKKEGETIIHHKENTMYKCYRVQYIEKEKGLAREVRTEKQNKLTI